VHRIEQWLCTEFSSSSSSRQTSYQEWTRKVYPGVVSLPSLISSPCLRLICGDICFSPNVNRVVSSSTAYMGRQRITLVKKQLKCNYAIVHRCSTTKPRRSLLPRSGGGWRGRSAAWPCSRHGGLFWLLAWTVAPNFARQGLVQRGTVSVWRR